MRHVLFLISAFVLAQFPVWVAADEKPAEPPPDKWMPATAYAVPKETAPEGEGYFSIIEGHNGRLYIGTHANGLNAWLVEFDPKTERMRPVVFIFGRIALLSSEIDFSAGAHVVASMNFRLGSESFGIGPDLLLGIDVLFRERKYRWLNQKAMQAWAVGISFAWRPLVAPGWACRHWPAAGPNPPSAKKVVKVTWSPSLTG
jgi:hypothetical protein